MAFLPDLPPRAREVVEKRSLGITIFLVGAVLLLIQNIDPIAAVKVPWFQNPELRDKGIDIRTLDSEPVQESEADEQHTDA